MEKSTDFRLSADQMTLTTVEYGELTGDAGAAYTTTQTYDGRHRLLTVNGPRPDEYLVARDSQELRRQGQATAEKLARILIMRVRDAISSVVGLAVGACVVGGVIWFFVRYSRTGAVTVVASVVVMALLAILIGLATDRISGAAVFAAGSTLLINDALLANHFATILGFGHLSLANAIGLWPASALLVLAISAAYLWTLIRRTPWLADGRSAPLHGMPFAAFVHENHRIVDLDRRA